MKLLLIDNYDSFLYNLKYEFEQLGSSVTVCRNDINYDKLCDLIAEHDAIVLSPGPSTPKNAGHCLRVIKDFYQQKPMLGICLGHQAMVEAFGGIVSHARKVMHGKTSNITLEGSPMFINLDKQLRVARYHSLIAVQMPEQLTVTARTELSEIMAIEHPQYPIYGLQFHPESLMTTVGNRMLQNFCSIVEKQNASKEAGHVAVA